MFETVVMVLLFSMFLILIRFLKGPTLSDRVVAFDALSVVSVSVLVILALYFERSIYLDVALVFGVIGFLNDNSPHTYFRPNQRRSVPLAATKLSKPDLLGFL